MKLDSGQSRPGAAPSTSRRGASWREADSADGHANVGDGLTAPVGASGQPGPELAEQLSVYQQNLREKNRLVEENFQLKLKLSRRSCSSCRRSCGSASRRGRAEAEGRQEEAVAAPAAALAAR